jgi:hypothetical protein
MAEWSLMHHALNYNYPKNAHSLSALLRDVLYFNSPLTPLGNCFRN